MEELRRDMPILLQRKRGGEGMGTGKHLEDAISMFLSSDEQFDGLLKLCERFVGYYQFLDSFRYDFQGFMKRCYYFLSNLNNQEEE